MSKHMQRLYIIFHKIYDIVTCVRIKARFSTAGLQNRALKNTGHKGGMGGDAADISGDA
jgi:hypothetical protein